MGALRTHPRRPRSWKPSTAAMCHRSSWRSAKGGTWLCTAAWRTVGPWRRSGASSAPATP
eukprot:2446319-Lingulodinium_polyedra.AAC.1